MKNDKQIALSFQLFSGRFVTIIQYPKLISWNVWIRILVRRIFYPWPNL